MQWHAVAITTRANAMAPPSMAAYTHTGNGVGGSVGGVFGVVVGEVVGEVVATVAFVLRSS